ncbi:MAG: hypothetical protein RRX88_06390 [Raoultibacter sp.]
MIKLFFTTQRIVFVSSIAVISLVALIGWFSNVWAAPINDLQNTVQAELDKTFESLRVMAEEKTIEQENLQV